LKHLPLFRRNIPFTAYVEGWGLYSETLADELGLYTTAYERLGYLQAELHRASRLVIDTGIHDKKWTREEAIKYMVHTTGMPESEVIVEVERYIVNPGQACAYKVGQLRILQMREKAKKELKDKFDIKNFHNVILKNGSMPITILQTLVDEWIERHKLNL